MKKDEIKDICIGNIIEITKKGKFKVLSIEENVVSGIYQGDHYTPKYKFLDLELENIDDNNKKTIRLYPGSLDYSELFYPNELSKEEKENLISERYIKIISEGRYE